MFRDLVLNDVKNGAYDHILLASERLRSVFANLLLDMLEYCHKRPEVSGEVLWAKLREWGEAKFDEPLGLPAWSDLDLFEQAAVDLEAANTRALAAVLVRFAPARDVAVVIRAAAPKIEDTIFEQHGSLGERDEHRVQAISAVSRVLEAAGLDPKSVMKPEALDEITLDDAGDGDEDDDDSGEGEGEGEDGEGETGRPADAPAPGAEDGDGQTTAAPSPGDDFMPASKRKAKAD